MRFNPAIVILAAAICGSVGCSSDTENNAEPWALNNSPNNTVNNATDNATNNTIAGCLGDSFTCVPGCGGDVVAESECVDNEWRCPTENGPWMPIEDCPEDACFGIAYPGEVCESGTQRCRPDLTGALSACVPSMCGTCEGFDPDAHDSPDCQCTCTDIGNVVCERTPPSCDVTNATTLDGVEIRLLGDDCSWTRDELAAGVTIAYEVVVDPVVASTTVFNQPQDAGGCGFPDASGLVTFFEINSDAGDRYCLCDSGLCAPNMFESPLVPGTHPGEFEWFGANWSGPSDTGNPMGAPFVATEATVTVSSVGTTGEGQDFIVTSRMSVSIAP